MKTVTVDLSDDTVRILDRAADASYYRRYPKPQVYGLIIADVIREVSILALCGDRRWF